MTATLRGAIRWVVAAGLAILLGGLAGRLTGAHAEPGVTADAITFGQSTRDS